MLGQVKHDGSVMKVEPRRREPRGKSKGDGGKGDRDGSGGRGRGDGKGGGRGESRKGGAQRKPRVSVEEK